MEIRHRDFTTVSLVPFEHQQLFPGEDCRVHVNVDLIIDEQTPVIKVGGTYDGKPATAGPRISYCVSRHSFRVRASPSQACANPAPPVKATFPSTTRIFR